MATNNNSKSGFLYQKELLKTIGSLLLILLCNVIPSHVAAFASSEDECNKDLEVFLNCNNPKIIEYLTALTKKDIGKVLSGVRLTDRSVKLEGHTFLGEAKGIERGVHLFIFKFKNNRVAYLWVERNGMELNLPVCPESVSHESAHVLSGDVYTWKAAQPGDGVIQTMCIKEEWLKKIK